MECAVKCSVASSESKFVSGTILLTNLGGKMPVWKKDDGTKSSVFSVHPAVKLPDMADGKAGLAYFERRLNKITGMMDYMCISFDLFENRLDQSQTIRFLIKEDGKVDVGYNPIKPGSEETTETITEEEAAAVPV